MVQSARAEAFRSLHVKGTPLVLWNIWDAGSAKAVAGAGAKALATGSWSVAAAQGFADGEALPLENLLTTAAQIVGAVDLPVSVDFEGGYAASPEGVGRNAAALIATGAVGLNFEDRIVGGKGLYPLADQARRIAAIRQAAEAADVPFFINARTDVFFGGSEGAPDALLEEALERAGAYAAAGADGLFVPGVNDPGLIAQICARQELPVNVMRMKPDTEISALAELGVARISHGPGPYRAAMQALQEAAVT